MTCSFNKEDEDARVINQRIMTDNSDYNVGNILPLEPILIDMFLLGLHALR